MTDLTGTNQPRSRRRPQLVWLRARDRVGLAAGSNRTFHAAEPGPRRDPLSRLDDPVSPLRGDRRSFLTGFVVGLLLGWHRR